MQARSNRRAPPALGLMIGVSTALFLVGLTLPTVRFERLGSEPEIYSILGGVRSLWDDGNWVLALVVLAFSVILPAAKHGFLLLAWYGLGGVNRRGVLELFERYGKWSMLDVFIIALFVGAVLPGVLADASSLAGIRVFGVAIVLSMIATRALLRWDERGAELLERARAPGGAWPNRPRRIALALLSLAGAGAFAWGLSRAFFTIEESFFSKNDVRLGGTIRLLAAEGERSLALVLALFVVLATAVRSFLLLCARWIPNASRAALVRVLRWDEWAMLDVFVLALFVVYIKLAELTTTTRPPGFWWLLAAGLLMNVDVWVLRREAGGGEGRG